MFTIIATRGSHTDPALHSYCCSDKLFFVERWARAVRPFYSIPVRRDTLSKSGENEAN